MAYMVQALHFSHIPDTVAPTKEEKKRLQTGKHGRNIAGLRIYSKNQLCRCFMREEMH